MMRKLGDFVLGSVAGMFLLLCAVAFVALLLTGEAPYYGE